MSRTALYKYPDNQVVADRYGQLVTGRDIKTLNPERWINDVIVNFIFGQKNGIRTHKNRMFIFNSYFMKKLLIHDRNIVRWFAKSRERENLDNVTRFVFPFNIDNVHWVLIVVDRKMKVIEVYDSLEQRINVFNAVNTLKQILTQFHWAEQHWKVEDKRMFTQPNSYDCGVYMIFTAVCLESGVSSLLYSRMSSRDLRESIGSKILYDDFIRREALRQFNIEIEKLAYELYDSLDEDAVLNAYDVYMADEDEDEDSEQKYPD